MALLSKPIPPNPRLEALLKKSAEWFAALSPIDRHEHFRAQQRSWVIGEMMLEHPEMTREEAERIYNEVSPR